MGSFLISSLILNPKRQNPIGTRADRVNAFSDMIKTLQFCWYEQITKQLINRMRRKLKTTIDQKIARNYLSQIKSTRVLFIFPDIRCENDYIAKSSFLHLCNCHIDAIINSICVIDCTKMKSTSWLVLDRVSGSRVRLPDIVKYRKKPRQPINHKIGITNLPDASLLPRKPESKTNDPSISSQYMIAYQAENIEGKHVNNIVFWFVPHDNCNHLKKLDTQLQYYVHCSQDMQFLKQVISLWCSSAQPVKAQDQQQEVESGLQSSETDRDISKCIVTGYHLILDTVNIINIIESTTGAELPNIINQMFSPKSPKSKKLMLFQEKLSRLSNKQEASVSHSKLEKLESQNQQFEREISDILDRIAQYYHMRQQRVSAECKQIVEALQRRELYLIDLLARYKQAQIEEVKECGDQFVSFQKSIRNRMRELESSSVSSDFLVQINNIKPFNLRKLHSKTEDMIFNRSTLQKQLDCFESLKSIITQHLNPRDNKLADETSVNKPISLNKTTNNQKGLVSRKMDNESRMNEIRKKANQFKENQHQLSYKNSKNNSNDEVQLENLLFQPKTQENLMDDESCKSPTQKLEPWKELKFLKSYEEEDQDIKVQKSVYSSVARKQQKIDKEIPKQSSIQLKNSIQAVLQMKRSQAETIINPINGRFSSDINSKRNLIMSIRPSSLTRVKSQEGFIFKSRANPDSIREHHDISSKQIENISAVGSVRASKVGMESKTARKGDWAQILKQQQTKYNEMRKKLKS